jgi:hypothetical protein
MRGIRQNTFTNFYGKLPFHFLLLPLQKITDAELVSYLTLELHVYLYQLYQVLKTVNQIFRF